MNRNYKRPRVDEQWAACRETHPAVATAIHAIASRHRTPDAIWADPTGAEFDHVRCAVEEYVLHGDFSVTDVGEYAWGAGSLRLRKEYGAE